MVRALVRKRAIGRLARYGGYALYASPYKRARIAGTVARYAVNYGPKAYKAARRLARWYRKKRSQRSKIGENLGTANAKRHTTLLTAGLTDISTRTLYTQHLTAVNSFGTDANDRARNVVNFRGFRLCLHFANQLSNPMYLNVAVVSNKAEATTPGITEFFRNTGGSSRSQSFSNTLSPLEFRCTPINADKYAVLSHKRYLLAGNGNGSTTHDDRSRPNYIVKKMYKKLNRQLRFAANTDGIPDNDPVYLVWWCDDVTAVATSTPITNACKYSMHLTTYFRETCAC